MICVAWAANAVAVGIDWTIGWRFIKIVSLLLLFAVALILPLLLVGWS
jgi:hypothetical protein